MAVKMVKKTSAQTGDKVVGEIISDVSDIPKEKVAPGPKTTQAPIKTHANVEFPKKSGKLPVDANYSEGILVSNPYVTVTVKLGTTVNTGDFNSVRLDVGIAYPCTPGAEEDTFAMISNWTGEKLELLYNQYIETEKK